MCKTKKRNCTYTSVFMSQNLVTEQLKQGISQIHYCLVKLLSKTGQREEEELWCYNVKEDNYSLAIQIWKHCCTSDHSGKNRGTQKKACLPHRYSILYTLRKI